ncbi:MAG: hypothetical protein ACRDIV_18920 [Ktedonobacteraceae bacterium]
MSNGEQDPLETAPSGLSSDEEVEEFAEVEGAEELDENDVAQAAKYVNRTQADSGYITSVVGDHPQVNINYYIEIVRRTKGEKHDDQHKELDHNTGDTKELIKANLDFERQNATFFANTGAETTFELPGTLDGIAEWYHGLNEYEQCYVQAAAILHGAPARDVSIHADILFKPLYEQGMQNASSSQEEKPQVNQEREKAHFSDIASLRRPGKQLRVNTHTVNRRVQEVERLFWQDVDAYGLSKFGSQVLLFLANEFLSLGLQGQNFLNELKEWSKGKKGGECSWRSAHALGVVLWYQNAHELRSMAKGWAKESSFLSRRRAASLLEGAYEIERIEDPVSANNSLASSVLQLLDEWVGRSQSQLGPTSRNLRCTAAYTYGLIGKQSPEIALRGLASLFQLPKSTDNENTRAIFAAGISAYVGLVWAGHIRGVLAHLAANAERFSHRHSLPKNMQERQHYRRQREVHLNATFEAFFLITAATLPEVQSEAYYLIERLPAQIAVPDFMGRDVLLTAILLEDAMSEAIMTLLCAAIVERNSNPAFQLMRRWTETTLKMQEMVQNEAERVYIALKRFLVSLGEMVSQWCYARKSQGLRLPQANEVYIIHLEQWRKESPGGSCVLSTLAQDVLKHLGKRV